MIDRNKMETKPSFTWVPVHRKIVDWLQGKGRTQQEMISLLKNLGITGFKDIAENNKEIELTEIDPFTFFCYLYKHGSEKRLLLLGELCKQLKISPLPSDDHGIPSANAQKVWLFPWKHRRKNNEIPRLWRFFDAAVRGTITSEDFEDVRTIKNAGKVKLTEGLFYVDPEKYLPINKQVKPYLESIFKIDPTFESFDDYQRLLQQVKEKTNEPFYKISYDAWRWNTGQSSPHTDTNDKDNIMHNSLNQIFFGPPGTGKTYHTVSEAIRIVDPEYFSANQEDRAKLKERFRELLINDWANPKGQIAFCTFHQSFSYEDFVEGIKPIKPQAGDTHVKYIIEPGIFKRICQLAEENRKSNLLKTQRVISWNDEVFKKAVFYKISLGDANKDEDQAIYEYCIKKNCIALGYGGEVDFTGLDEEQIINKCKENGEESFTAQAVNRFIHYLKKENYVLVSYGNRYVRAIGKVVGSYKYDPDTSIRYKHFRPVEWIAVNQEIPITDLYDRYLSQQTIYKLDEDGIKKEFFVSNGQQAKAETASNKNFVLIIDEINRGNVSSIFGELITLIEKDKRANGSPDSEELEVILPYSKESFKVPDNVHIIGTMNTADRSIEALDTALRRRFSFREMQSNPDALAKEGASKGKIGKVDLVRMLNAINQRIEKLIDKDHKIGHAYFMEDTTEEHLKNTFHNKVIPLLQEYFFGDFGKIGLVLGSSFIEIISDDFEFAKFDGYDQSIKTDLKDRPLYKITHQSKWDFQSIYE